MYSATDILDAFAFLVTSFICFSVNRALTFFENVSVAFINVSI